MPPTDDTLTPLDTLLSDWEEEGEHWARCRHCRASTHWLWRHRGAFPHAEDCPVWALATVRAELVALRARPPSSSAARERDAAVRHAAQNVADTFEGLAQRPDGLLQLTWKVGLLCRELRAAEAQQGEETTG